MLSNEREQEFQQLFQQFKADPELRGNLARVSYADLFTDEFLAENSRFSSLDDLLYRGGFGITNPLEIDSIPKERWDAYIAQYTPYAAWHDFGKVAMIAWMKRTLASAAPKAAN